MRAPPSAEGGARQFHYKLTVAEERPRFSFFFFWTQLGNIFERFKVVMDKGFPAPEKEMLKPHPEVKKN